VVQPAVAVAHDELRRVVRAGRYEPHAAIVAHLDGAQRSPGTPPGDELAEWRDVRPARDQLAHESRVRFGSVGKAEGGSEVRMPDADPESTDVLTALGEGERVVDPLAWRLDALILAQRAVHPGERRFIDADGLLALGVPERNDV